MELRSHQRHWEDLSTLDPYWAILSDPAKKHGGWEAKDFLESGEIAIDQLMARIQLLDVPLHRGSALDFGCGAGRLTHALGQRFDTSIGVDISSQMVALAERLSESPNCRFLVNTRDDLALFDDSAFDLVYTELVLQHLPSRPLILRYISEFVRVLRDGGMLAFQLPSYIPVARRVQPRPRLYRLLRSAGVSPGLLYRRLRMQPIRMQAIAVGDVCAHLIERGATVLNVDTVDVPSGVKSSTYFATR